VVGQSEFQDWITAEGVNDRLRLLDQRADELQTLFLSGDDRATSPAAPDAAPAGE